MKNLLLALAALLTVFVAHAAVDPIAGALSVCPGATFTLTDATPGGTWSSSNTSVATIGSSTGLVSAIAPGTTMVTYTMGAEYATAVLTVNTFSAPVTGALGICAGQAALLSCAPSGGGWSVAVPAIATINPVTGSVMGVAAGTTTVSYSLPELNCVSTAVITVNTTPSSIAGPLSFCAGASSALTSTPPGGSWSSSNASVLTIGSSSGIVSAIATGTAGITYTLAGSGCNATGVTTVSSTPVLSGPGSVCIGQSISLSGVPGSGAWSASPSGIVSVVTGTGIVTGIATGTTVVTYTLTGGCFTTTTITVLPAPAAITGTLAMCTGGTTTLNCTTTGGSWTSANTAIGSVQASGTLSGSAFAVIAGVSAGTVEVTYTAPGACAVTAVLTVHSTPASPTGPLVVCEGQSTTLGFTPAGGAWSSLMPAIGTIDAVSGVFTGITPGTATVNYATGTGCMALLVVTVNALPAAITGGPLAICAGATATLLSTPAPGTWSSSAPATGSVNATGVVAGIAAGIVNITYTRTNGCYRTASVTINALPGAITGGAAVCEGASVSLSCTPPGGTWSSSSPAVGSIATDGSFTGISAGTATVTYTLPTGCRSTLVMLVSALPAAISGMPTVCGTGTATLTGTPAGGTWSSSDPAVATITFAGHMAGVSPGTSLISYTLPTGCSTTSVATVGAALPAITGALAICAGTTGTVNCATPGGTWSSSSPFVATVTATGEVAPVSSGTTIITYAISPACRTTAVVTVYSLPAVISGSLSACVGSTVTLTSTPGGTWMSAAPAVGTISSTGVVSAISAGTMTVTYTAANGCYRIAVLTVNALPSAISGSFTTCVGNVITLTATPAGGTWASSNPGVASITMPGGVVSGISGPMTATISYTLSTGCRTTAVVTVYALPAALSGSITVCTGSSIALGGAGGTWATSDAAVATIDGSGLLTGVNPGTVIITYTSATTGCSQTKVATVNGLPTGITGTLIACPGNSTPLAGAPTGGAWSSSAPIVASISSAGVVTTNNSGTAVISYTLSTGCYRTAVFTVNPLPSPIGGALGVCETASTTLSSIPVGGTWSSPSPGISIGSSTGVVTGIAAGTNIVSYTISSGCVRTAVVSVNAGIGSLGGTLEVCAGAATALTNGVAGGTWTSSNPAVGSVSSTGIVTGLTAGTTSITYTAPPPGCIGVAIVTVNYLPSVITGPDGFCNFTTATYTAAPAGGVWSVADPAIVSLGMPAAGVVTGVGNGTTTLTYTLATGCSRTKDIFTILAPTPITGPDEVCAGASIQLTNLSAGGSWSSSAPGIATVGTSGLVAGVALGVASITYSLSTGCFSVLPVTVTGIQPAITGALSFCGAAGTTLASSVAGGIWSSSNNAIATIDAAGVVSAVAPGTVSISYAAVSGCTASVIATVQSAVSPAISGPSAHCVGNVIPFTVSAIGGAWSSSNTAVGTISSDGSLTAIATGTTTVSYVSACGTLTHALAITNAITAHSVVPTADTACGPARFYIGSCGSGSGLAVTTWFGDGTHTTQALVSSGGVYSADVLHTYTGPGTYTVKHVLLTEGVPGDSVTFTYEQHNCNVVPVKFFTDNNANCVHDAGEGYSMLPIATRIDSAGVPIDTIVATSGFYYKAHGAPGTVYAFRPLAISGGMAISCPSGGVIYDTVGAYATSHLVKYFALACTASPAHDLSVSGTMLCGRHTARYDMVISNSSCMPVNPVVTLTFSPKYNFTSANVTPTSVAGNTITWNLAALSTSGTTTKYITVWLDRPGPISNWLLPGDTVSSTLSAGPLGGDSNPANNVKVRQDTVKSSFDPNDIMVTPAGYILPCTQLQYRIRFENKGNAAAQNIHILDTLSASLDPASIAPVVASAAMNISVLADGGYNIVRFDFPDINLADSSHPDDNKGMVVFNINARSTVADGTHIMNRAGIYFDDNPEVMTNDVENITGMPAITGADSVCAGSSIILANLLPGGAWSASNTRATIAGGTVSGVAYGLDTMTYTASNACTLRTLSKTVFVNTIPAVVPVAGAGDMCPGWVVKVTNDTPLGTWSVSNSAVAAIDELGMVSALAAGTSLVSYTVANTCGLTAASDTIHVNPMLTPSVILTSDAVPVLCDGTPVLFHSAPVHGGTDPFYMWYVNGLMVQGENGDTLRYTPVDGDVVTTRVSSSEACVTDAFASTDMTMHVTANVMPSVTTAAAPAGRLCQGSLVTLTATTVNGGSGTVWWVKNGVATAATGTTYTYAPVNGDVVYCRLASSLPCLIADTVSSAARTLAVDSAYIPVVEIGARPGTYIAAGQSDTLFVSVAGAGVAPHYQWAINGVNIAGATAASFVSSTLRNADSVSCTVTGSGVCEYKSFNALRINVSAVSVPQAAGPMAFSIMPNPSSGTFTITGTVAAGGDDIVACVTDLLGRMVYHTVISAGNGAVQELVQLPGHIGNGVYMLSMRAGTASAVYRIVVQR